MTIQTRTERRELTTGGRTTAIHIARASERAATSGVLVLHPWWGLNDDIRAYADRLAEAGFTAAAPDLYEGRVATTIEDADRLSTELDEDVADAFVLASLDELGRTVGAPSARLGVIGFSLGAAWALWLPAQRPEVAASVVYYGTMEGPSLARGRVPVLGHFAEQDEYEPEASVRAFEASLRAGGRDVEIARYPGVGHWFAEPSRDAHDPDAAELAWQRTLAFLRRHLVDAGPG
jgi:carboxymethylenebutenolidase